MILVHAHHLYLDLVSFLYADSNLSDDLNNLFVKKGFPVLDREDNVVMNLPSAMISFSNRASSVHPLSITTNPCSKLQGTFKLDVFTGVRPRSMSLNHFTILFEATSSRYLIKRYIPFCKVLHGKEVEVSEALLNYFFTKSSTNQEQQE
jgi:hypothetical protein